MVDRLARTLCAVVWSKEKSGRVSDSAAPTLSVSTKATTTNHADLFNIGNRVTLSGESGIIEFVPDRFHMTDSPLAARAMIESGLGVGLHLPSMIHNQLKCGEL